MKVTVPPSYMYSSSATALRPTAQFMTVIGPSLLLRFLPPPPLLSLPFLPLPLSLPPSLSPPPSLFVPPSALSLSKLNNYKCV